MMSKQFLSTLLSARNSHYVIILVVLLFGIISNTDLITHPIGRDPHALFDWPSSFYFVWLWYVLVLLIVTIAFKMGMGASWRGTPVAILVFPIVTTIGALWMCCFAHVFVYEDGIKLNTVSVQGLHSDRINFSDVTGIVVGCKIATMKGQSAFSIQYSFTAPDHDPVDFGEGRRPHSGDVQWMKAIEYVDPILRSRKIDRTVVEGQNPAAVTICIKQFVDAHSPNDAARMEEIFKPTGFAAVDGN